MTAVFVTKVCACGKEFKTSNGSTKCYDCTLEDITHGNPPEEGDFNTAGIVSGTLTSQERSNLQSDLESIDNSRTTEEEYEDEDPDEDVWAFNEWESAKLGDEG
jgi:hypothetical protein